MTKEEAIQAASRLLMHIYHADEGSYEKMVLTTQILTAETDRNVDYLCSALDKVIEICETLKRNMYNQE